MASCTILQHVARSGQRWRDLCGSLIFALMAISSIASISVIPALAGQETAKPAAAASDADQTADVLIGMLNKPWTGDYSGMVERRFVRVLLPYSKTFYFLDKGERKGINYEFFTRFEDFLNGETKEKKGQKPSRIEVVMIPTPRDELLRRLVEGRGDLVAGNLTITGRRLEDVDFSIPWLTGVEELVVTPASAKEIGSVDELSGMAIHVRQSSSYRESLLALNERFEAEGKQPADIVASNELLEDEDLLEMVNADAVPAIIVDSHKAKFWAQVFDNIRIHEKAAIRSDGEIAWAFRKNSPELAAQVNTFIKSIKKGTELGNIIFARYLKRKKWLRKLNDEADRRKFRDLIGLFAKYGEQYDINWLILAAKAYQESRFDNAARYKGAVGIMQIKPSTAAAPEINVRDITQLENNIHAGTKYIRYLMDQYYSDLASDPFNQTLFAFAGYNAGPERIAGLRKKARERGLDGSKWFNNVEWVVAESVGPITVDYVRNIFQYFIIYSGVYDRYLQLQETGRQ